MKIILFSHEPSVRIFLSTETRFFFLTNNISNQFISTSHRDYIYTFMPLTYFDLPDLLDLEVYIFLNFVQFKSKNSVYNLRRFASVYVQNF